MNQQQLAKLKSLLKAKHKLSHARMALKLGCSSSAVSYTIRMYGLIPIEERGRIYG